MFTKCKLWTDFTKTNNTQFLLLMSKYMCGFQKSKNNEKT